MSEIENSLSSIAVPEDDHKKCNWCKSTIIDSATFCKECGLWQSPIRQWLAPSALLSLVGAMAAWLAVMYQIIPKDPNPILVAAQAVEALEFKVKEGCENNKTNRCIHEFWSLYATAEDTRSKVPDLGVRNELRQRINIVMDKHAYKYVELYEFEPLNN